MRGKVAVIGAGAWGTAIAHCLATNGAPTTIWAFEEDVVDSINRESINKTFLPEVHLPEGLNASTDMAEAVDGCDIIFFVVPSRFMRSIFKNLLPHLKEGVVVASATKGIETDTLSLPIDMIEREAPQYISEKVCCLSGPTFAKELVAKIPTAATIASKDVASAKLVQERLANHYFRLYAHDDIVGVEIGGAVKNVIAIAAGISDGMGFGDNTRAGVVTRGLAEMTRLGVTMGADAKTFYGLSGMGDLTLTCYGDLSRNRSVGARLGRGEKISDITESMTAVAEGVTTALSVHRLAEKQGVDMPISAEVYRVIYEDKAPELAVKDLMSRVLKPEF